MKVQPSFFKHKTHGSAKRDNNLTSVENDLAAVVCLSFIHVVINTTPSV